MAKSNHHIVSHWFAEQMATGAIARDDAAHAQAIAAKDDLVKRLDGAKGPPASLVGEWFLETIATGAIARNTVAYNQAFAAKGELIARLAPTEVPANAVRQPARSSRKRVKPAPAKAPPLASIPAPKTAPETPA